MYRDNLLNLIIYAISLYLLYFLNPSKYRLIELLPPILILIKSDEYTRNSKLSEIEKKGKIFKEFQ